MPKKTRPRHVAVPKIDQTLSYPRRPFVYIPAEPAQNKACVEQPVDRWIRFLREGKQLDDAHLPEYMQTKEMRQAMSVLRQFSEKERDYHQYQARINYLRERNSMEQERDLAVQERDVALRRELAAMQERDVALRRELATMQERDRVAQKLERAMQRERASMQEHDRVAQELERAMQELLKLRQNLE